MSWQLASFVILAIVLVGGFAWYERSRPPAQVVALVASLAAMAIAGRIAFAAFPNVKPTTDIVIFAGYALGGAPGFAVGALAALVSNFWFGQGVWTPWQMVAWGLCGLLGALLALVARRPPNRFVLAAVCGFAGLAFGALMNFSLMASYGGELSWASFGVYETRAIPFEIAHAGGNVVLALVAGPAMLRMLVRFRERFEWSRRQAGETNPGDGGAPGRRLGPALGGTGVALLLAAALTVGSPAPASARADAATGADWLAGVQNEDGGWGSSPGDPSSTTITCWSMLGLEAAGRNPLDLAIDGRTAVDYLRAKGSKIKSSGSLALAILALDGAGVDPRHFGGRNLVTALLARRRSDGSYDGWPGSTAYAILALRSAGAVGAIPASANWLRGVQNEDGGWGDTPGSPSTADGTGAAMMALAGSGAAQRGIAFLRSQQRPNGGFPLGEGGSVNTMSTAWAVQGIVAAGGNPAGFKKSGRSPLDYLAQNQEADGHYRYADPGGGTSKLVAEQTPVWTTAQVLSGATETSYPIAAVAREAQATPPPSSRAPSSESAGGAPPSTFAPEGTPESSEPLPDELPGGLPAGAGPQSSGSPRNQGVAPGKKVPGGGKKQGSGKKAANGAPTEAGPGAEPTATAGEEATASSPASDAGGGTDSGTTGKVGAILTGLLAGCLLFGVAWLGRRGYMRRRYGV